jgi:hypothetical protein
MSDLRIVKQYDDTRILEGGVGEIEKSDLEVTLQRMYLAKAKEEGQDIKLHKDLETYQELRSNPNFFSEFHLLVDDHCNVLDMTPLAYHLIDTEQGLFYAKLMLHDECRQR